MLNPKAGEQFLFYLALHGKSMIGSPMLTSNDVSAPGVLRLVKANHAL
jgi:hypothetical protein